MKIDKMGEWLENAGKMIIGKVRLKLILQLTEIALGRVGVEIVKLPGEFGVG